MHGQQSNINTPPTEDIFMVQVNATSVTMKNLITKKAFSCQLHTNNKHLFMRIQPAIQKKRPAET